MPLILFVVQIGCVYDNSARQLYRPIVMQRPLQLRGGGPTVPVPPAAAPGAIRQRIGGEQVQPNRRRHNDITIENQNRLRSNRADFFRGERSKQGVST
jgi:hypothetical protein